MWDLWAVVFRMGIRTKALLKEELSAPWSKAKGGTHAIDSKIMRPLC